MKRRTLLQAIAAAVAAPLLPSLPASRPVLWGRAGQPLQGWDLSIFNVGDVVRFHDGKTPKLFVVTGESSLYPFGARQ